jgi:hypothetical protein
MSMKVNKMGRSIRRRFAKMQQTLNVLPKMLSFMSGFNKALGGSMGKMNKKTKRDVDSTPDYGSELSPGALDMLKDAGIDYDKPASGTPKKTDKPDGAPPSGGQFDGI